MICDRDLAKRGFGNINGEGTIVNVFASTERAVAAVYIRHLPHRVPVPLLLAITTRLSDVKSGVYSEDTWLRKSDFTTQPLRVIARHILERELGTDEGFDGVKWQTVILGKSCK